MVLIWVQPDHFCPTNQTSSFPGSTSHRQSCHLGCRCGRWPGSEHPSLMRQGPQSKPSAAGTTLHAPILQTYGPGTFRFLDGFCCGSTKQHCLLNNPEPTRDQVHHKQGLVRNRFNPIDELINDALGSWDSALLDLAI